MGTLRPFGIADARQDGAGETASQTQAAVSDEPYISAATEAQWVGFGVVIAIFVVVLIAIIRARVIKPAERAARDTRFFEPAGADADITFEDAAETSVEITKRGKKKDRKKNAATRKGLDQDAPTEIAPEDITAPNQELADKEPADVQPLEPEVVNDEVGRADADAADDSPAPKTSPFAGLFDRQETEDQVEQKAEEPETSHTEELVLTPDDAAEQPALLDTQPDDVRLDHLPEVDRDYWTADREHQETESQLRAEEERRLALEEAERARAAAADAEAARARREEEYREAETERRKAEIALDQNLQAVAGMQQKLDAMAGQISADAADAQTRMGASLDEKFESLSDDLQRRMASAAADISARHEESREESQKAVAAMQGTLGAEAAFSKIAASLAQIEQSTQDALARLSGRIDALSVVGKAEPEQPEELQRLNALLAERAAPAVAGVLQLGELVRSALPADRYALSHELKTGVKADCVILRSGAPGFVIDARYPADAYDRYARADDKSREHAATAYRRAVLRHMIFIAEKLIIPDETEDFAMLFVPNDAIFNDLHRHFADIVQDSYRARIWLVSPTSLMATLHVMSAATRLGEETRTPVELALQSAINDLTARIDAMEEKLQTLATAPQVQDVSLPAASEPAETLPSAGAIDADFEEAEIEILGPEDEAADGHEPDNEYSATTKPQSSFPLR